MREGLGFLIKRDPGTGLGFRVESLGFRGNM